MKQIRRSVFETNSSSVHSLTILPEDQFEKFKRGEMLLDSWKHKLISKEDALKEINKYDKDFTIEDLKNGHDDYRTYNNIGGDYYETFEEYHTTKGGDKIVVFGYYGYN